MIAIVLLVMWSAFGLLLVGSCFKFAIDEASPSGALAYVLTGIGTGAMVVLLAAMTYRIVA